MHDLGDRVILASELLASIPKDERSRYMFPIVEKLVAAASPIRHENLPPTILAGLQFAHQVQGAALPEKFISERELGTIFSKPLRTGLSHQDLHWRNVMRRGCEPILIDLRKCRTGRIIALDILNMACLSMATQQRANIVQQAYTAHQKDWNNPELRAMLDLVDLPRQSWGPVYALHVIGQYATKRRWAPKPTSGVLFRWLLSLDWTRAA